MNDVSFNWSDFPVFLEVMASCGTVVGLAGWAMKLAAIHKNEKEDSTESTQAVAGKIPSKKMYLSEGL